MDEERVNKIVEKLNKAIENMSREERIKLLSKYERRNGGIDFATLQKEHPELLTREDVLEWAGGGLYEGVNPIYKEKKNNKVLWVQFIEPKYDDKFVFTFDKKHFFNLFEDYPDKLTAEEKRIFDKEEPYWRDYFANRDKE